MQTTLSFSPARLAAPGANVVAQLSYLVSSAERPVSYAFQPPDGTPWESATYEAREMPICDARSALVRSSVHREGFELWDAPSATANFYDDDEVRRVYYPEAAELALAVSGGQRAWVFDHLVRRREPDRRNLSFGRALRGVAAANGRVHNDYTEASGTRRLAQVVPDEQQRSRLTRFCILNVWRSIRGAVRDTPLAVCNAGSVTQSELVIADVHYPRRTGEIYLASHSPSHRWSYYSAMEKNEALVFKQFDSVAEGVARFTPHAAFDHPHAPADAPPRESIEVRCLVGFE